MLGIYNQNLNLYIWYLNIYSRYQFIRCRSTTLFNLQTYENISSLYNHLQIITQFNPVQPVKTLLGHRISITKIRFIDGCLSIFDEPQFNNYLNRYIGTQYMPLIYNIHIIINLIISLNHSHLNYCLRREDQVVVWLRVEFSCSNIEK